MKFQIVREKIRAYEMQKELDSEYHETFIDDGRLL